MTDGHTTLYRMYDDFGVLYVGISGNPGRRFEQHSKDKPWWSEVSEIVLKHYRRRAQAERAEAEAIRVDRPPYNKAMSRAPYGRKSRPCRRHGSVCRTHHERWPCSYAGAWDLAHVEDCDCGCPGWVRHDPGAGDIDELRSWW